MCKYCWHPENETFSHSVIIENIPHNPGCPVIEGNFQDWEEGADWGWNNSSKSWRQYRKGKSKAYYMGVRSGQNGMEGLIQQAADDNYYGLHEREY